MTDPSHLRALSDAELEQMLTDASEGCVPSDHGAQLIIELRAAREELARLRAENERLTAEVEVLRGVGCLEDGDGPCGVCVKCLRIYPAAEELERMADTIEADDWNVAGSAIPSVVTILRSRAAELRR